jgi:hypothetical protein
MNERIQESDRKLLEYAAKAAGEWPSPEPFEHVLARWNPLTDDGDALRLAVQLRISSLIYPACIGTRWPLIGLPTKLIGTDAPYEDISAGQDPYAATRRAIVKAAAEIGRNMK